MIKRRTLCLCLALLLLLPMVLTGCGNDLEKTTKSFKKKFATDRISDGVVAQNDKYELEWNDSRQCALLHDKVNDKWYGSTPYDYYMDEAQLENTYVNYEVYNPIQLTYISTNKETNVSNEEKTTSLEGSVERGGASSELIDGGVRLTYNFPDVKITVVVELLLTENGLEVRVPMKSIRENENLVYEIAVMPYLVSAAHGGDGYVMIPSGGGALIYAQDLRGGEKIKSEPVYGSDLSEPVSMLKQNANQIHLPVFGASNGDSGMLGIIDQGAACAYINASAGDVDVGYTTAYASFRIRGKEEVAYSSDTGHTKAAYSYSKSVSGYEYLSVQYQPLVGDTSYVGMANTYRQYLIGKGYLQNRPTNVPALSVNFLGSTQVTESLFGIPYQTDVATTTLKQAQTISAELKELIGEDSLLVTLSGYGRGGLASTTIGGGFQLSNTVGNKKAWNSLLNFAKENNTVVALDYDLVTFQKGGNGFTVGRSASTTLSALDAHLASYNWSTAIEDEEGLSWYLLSRNQLGDAMKKAIQAASKLQLNTVSFSTLSHMAYGDYRDGKYTAKSLMDQDVAALLKQCAENKLAVVSTKANDYAALLSDYIIEAPMQSSKFTIYNEDIPFYALVFQGYKALTSASINTAVNVQTAYLDAVATGTTLHFTLCDTHHDALQFEQDTAYISSRYADWKSDIAAMVQESAALYEQVSGKAITAYEQANGLSKTVFENGVTVYVNYTDADLTCPLGTLPAMGFVFG